MMNLMWVCGVIGVVMSRLVNGFEDFEEFYNVTEVSYLESFYGGYYGVSKAATPLMVGLTLIQGAAAKGAVCLDGTLPAYHIHHGYGSGSRSWLIQLEGGGWCNTKRNCVYRKKTRRGSSIYMERQIPFTGILSNNPQENPDFFNWNRVKLRYCDGASFTGDSEDKAAGLQFRGQRIWLAAMEEFIAKGMRYANQALLSGCSAGALASILHCDEFHGLLPRASKVKCLSDAGLFLDAADVSGGRTLRNLFGGVVNLQGLSFKISCPVSTSSDNGDNRSSMLTNHISMCITGSHRWLCTCGSQRSLPRYCTNHLDPTSCFFPQNIIASVKTPLFLLNAAYDSWQIQASLAPVSADPHGYWRNCKMNHVRCSASQINFLQGFRNQMLQATKSFSMSRQNGLFINSCFAHCQTERQDTWFSDNSPAIGNKGIALAVGDWYFDRAGCKAIDCPYPCDKTCHNLVFR